MSCIKNDVSTSNIKDIYTCGYEKASTTYVTKVWKNSISTTLTDGINEGAAYGISVMGTDVNVVEIGYITAKNL